MRPARKRRGGAFSTFQSCLKGQHELLKCRGVRAGRKGPYGKGNEQRKKRETPKTCLSAFHCGHDIYAFLQKWAAGAFVCNLNSYLDDTVS